MFNFIHKRIDRMIEVVIKEVCIHINPKGY